uniref:DNA-directed RNA polymerase III subunit RPC3 n=1 Tax=Timema douglasi TaxID=61478 RepID=A0A7R8Z971_TIMDO|nr:unnamed protein product [Timema douglasi]
MVCDKIRNEEGNFSAMVALATRYEIPGPATAPANVSDNPNLINAVHPYQQKNQKFKKKFQSMSVQATTTYDLYVVNSSQAPSRSSVQLEVNGVTLSMKVYTVACASLIGVPVYLRHLKHLPLVKQAIRILIQYGFVSFSLGTTPNKPNYTLLPEKVYLLLRYPSAAFLSLQVTCGSSAKSSTPGSMPHYSSSVPFSRYLLLIKTRYGDEAEILVEEILRRGQDTASSVILQAFSRLNNTPKVGKADLGSLRDKFSLLVTKQFIMRCPSPNDEEGTVPVLTVKERELYLPPDLNLKDLLAMERGQGGSTGDEGVYWRINLDRFHQEFRDQIMVSAMERRIDANAGELMRLLLQQMYLRTEPWAAVSNPVPYTELKEVIRKQSSHPQLGVYLDQYLKVMGMFPGFTH